MGKKRQKKNKGSGDDAAKATPQKTPQTGQPGPQEVLPLEDFPALSIDEGGAASQPISNPAIEPSAETTSQSQESLQTAQPLQEQAGQPQPQPISKPTIQALGE